MEELFRNVIEWYMGNINYVTVMILMAIESSFIPFPSEIVVPPAAWKAAQGDLNIFLVVLFATVGALLGALLNYYLSLFIGRTLIYRFSNTRLAHLMMIHPSSIKKAEDYFLKHGRSSTFIGRLVPAVRQLISIPAGLAKMDIWNFVLYTVLGSTLWNISLAALGYFLYTQKDLLDRYFHELSLLTAILGVLFVVYLVWKAFRRKSNNDRKGTETSKE